MSDDTLTLSRGQMVLKDRFRAGSFIRSFDTRNSTQSNYGGTWDELEVLVEANKDNFEPGTGSVDNDVILVNVPADGFRTSIVEITEENAHLVTENSTVRAEGEKPVVMKIINMDKSPAKYVQIVCYRADVLAKDDHRTTDAEWEIVAILAQSDKVVPMHPTTMLRNSNHDKGGTYREYTDKEWADSQAYWANHAYAKPSK